MTWLQRHRVRSWLRDSFWFVPVIGLVAAVIAGWTVRRLEPLTDATFFAIGPEGARALVAALVGASFSFTVFVFSVLLLAVQMASAQLSPRIITSMLRDMPAKVALAVFVFTFAFDVHTLAAVERHVPQLAVFCSVVCTVVSIGAFLLLLDYAAHALRPVSIALRLGHAGVGVATSSYPELLGEGAPQAPLAKPAGAPALTISHSGPSGTVMAFDLDGLVRLAERAGGVIVLRPRVGDFVARGEPLADVYTATIDPAAIRQSVAIGPARTFDQDPAFPLRVLVDIAARALSPAMNDPTTAVLMLDQIHRLLETLGKRRLDARHARDRTGTLRLVYDAPDWDDFVELALSEIRLFGIGSLQIPRRLRAMLTDLLAVLPPVRHPALRAELRLVEAAVARTYADADDRARAGVPDRQGLGCAGGPIGAG